MTIVVRGSLFSTHVGRSICPSTELVSRCAYCVGIRPLPWGRFLTLHGHNLPERRRKFTGDAAHDFGEISKINE